MAGENPEHRAVLRKTSWLPSIFFGPDTWQVADNADSFDDIDIDRIMLDGYRALIRCLDTDLESYLL